MAAKGRLYAQCVYMDGSFLPLAFVYQCWFYILFDNVTRTRAAIKQQQLQQQQQ